MVGRLFLLGALAVSVAIVIAGACAPQGQTGPTATPLGIASPTRSVAPATTAPAAPTASPSPTPSRSPSPTAAGACASVSGGTAAAQAQLVGLRIAHQPGFDRVVFEFGPSTAPGPFAMPKYQIEPASSFTAVSGQRVPLDGNAFLSARFQNASTVSPSTGQPTYPGSTDLRPGTPLVREVKLIEDFERVMAWGLGLDRPACPAVSELANPLRLVLDLPTPP
ncbi:MAG TPA: hypothetical protein VM070_08815 [Candidatus Saccharimonadales bacterium]|nr:hypothetical protein [Candidatus Saccharimonadales bacterium]